MQTSNLWAQLDLGDNELKRRWNGSDFQRSVIREIHNIRNSFVWFDRSVMRNSQLFKRHKKTRKRKNASNFSATSHQITNDSDYGYLVNGRLLALVHRDELEYGVSQLERKITTIIIDE